MASIGLGRYVWLVSAVEMAWAALEPAAPFAPALALEDAAWFRLVEDAPPEVAVEPG